MQHPKVISFHVWQKTEDVTAHPKKLRISGQWISATPKAPALNLPFLRFWKKGFQRSALTSNPSVSDSHVDHFSSSLCKYTQVTKIGKWIQKLSENHEILQVSRQKSLPHLSRSSMGWCLSHPNVSDFTKAPLFKRSMGCDAWAFFCLEKWR